MLNRPISALALVPILLTLTACSKQEAEPVAVVEEIVEESAEQATLAGEDALILESTTSAVITATVEAIDLENRIVTLRGEDPEPVAITVGEEAHNLDLLKVGDTVTAEYEQSVSVELIKQPEITEPGAVDLIAQGRAEKGESPAGAVVETLVIVSIVEAINLEDNTFRLKGPDGEVREYTAQDPENLKRADVGDAVVITFTEARAVAVTATAAEEGSAAPAE